MPRLTCRSAAGLLSLLLVAPVAAQTPTSDGNVMLTNVLATIQRHASISAQLRQQTKLGQLTQVGSGYYRQQGTADRPRTYWEMKTQVAGETASFVQIFDGSYLWTDRRLPSGRQVRRLDVELLHARLRDLDSGSTPNLLLKTEGQGGLAQLLAELLRNFSFDRPHAAQLGDLPVYALLGTWRPAQLQLIWPAAADQTEPPPWPAQIPHHVLVLVGHNMFPYVFELRGQHEAYLASTVAGLRPTPHPLLRYELFDVHFARAIRPSQFQFKDGVEWKDETGKVWEALRQRSASLRAKL